MGEWPAKHANYAKVGEGPTEYTEDTEKRTREMGVEGGSENLPYSVRAVSWVK